LLEHADNLRLAEKIHRTPADAQPHAAYGHSPGPEAGPGGEKLLSRDPADQAQALRRIRDVIPEADGDRLVENLLRFPMKDVRDMELAGSRHTLAGREGRCEADHFGSNIN